MVVVLTRATEAVALGQAMFDAQGIATAEKGVVVRTERVLIPEIFPKLWQRAGSASKGAKGPPQ
jgi:predicted ribosome-associated RNA-binding protein Tma20